VRLWVVVKRTQLTKLVSERNQGRTISMSAMKAGMSRTTATKYLGQNDVTEQTPAPHKWRTRKDPLEAIWPKAEEMLLEAPELEAKALFEHLAYSHPEPIKPGLLRTFQRRVKAWRLKVGPEKEVFFTQDVKPGETLAVDWTDMKPLGITIQGRMLDHKLFHAVLLYSNWQWATRAHSESVLSLRAGLKAALSRLGRVPRELLTDQSSTATHQLTRDGARRGFNEEYLGICAHYGLEPRTINVARPQENGCCESCHGHLKRRIKQHLLLRGSRDFDSEEAYDRFLITVLEAGNALRTQRLTEELAVMRGAPAAELPDFRESMVTVNNNSTIRLRKQVYSVPARLIGKKLLAREHENRIVLLAGAEVVAELPVERGGRGAAIDYRHVIGHLLRKPGAFANYRWREEMFPSPAYRAAHDWLERRDPFTASRRYLEILKLAADEGETAVENALEQLLANHRAEVSAKEVRAMLDTWRELKTEWRNRPPLAVNLTDYDQLLEGIGDFTGGVEGEELAATTTREVAHV
jgi:transposase